jgi:hypothetical protein
MRVSLPQVSGDYLRGRWWSLAMLLAFATALELAAGTGLAYLAGFGRVHAVLARCDWVWLAALVGALGVSFVGYYYAYQGMFSVAGGPRLQRWQLRTAVTVGFGGLLARIADRYALLAVGASPAEARTRVYGLAGLEYGMLALGATGAAIAVLVSGSSQARPDVTIPWAVIPVPGLLIAFWAAENWRGRFRDQPGWRGHLGSFLESVHLIRAMFISPRRYGVALAGMALFWASAAFAAWAGMAAFGFRMTAASMFLGFATGMVFTPRTGPMGGAGVLTLCLPLALWYTGAPLAVAVTGIFAYRVLTLWLPMPASIALLRALRTMGQPVPQAGEHSERV